MEVFMIEEVVVEYVLRNIGKRPLAHSKSAGKTMRDAIVTWVMHALAGDAAHRV